MTAPATTPSAALAQAAHDAAMLLAVRVETAADEIGSCYAGLEALAAASACPKIGAVAGEIGRFVGFLRGLEIADGDMLEVPAETLAALSDFADEIAASGRELPALVIPPEPPAGGYADGIREGLRRAQLLGQVQTMRRRRVRR